MKIKNMFKTSLLALAFGAATVASSQAAQINGEINFLGVGTLVGGATAATATGITFLGVTTTLAFGDYVGVPLTTPTAFTSFNFGAPGTTGANVVIPLWTLTVGPTTYSFDLSSITINSAVGSQRNLEGSGTAYITGFDPTPGTWTLSSSGQQTTVVFSSATNAVPDGGTSLALLGGSLLGLAGLRRKFLRN